MSSLNLMPSTPQSGLSDPPRFSRRPIAAIVGLGLIASALGLLPWPRPDWSPSSTWMIDEVPGLLWIFVSSATLVCTSTATVLTLRGIGLRGRDWLTWAWLGVAWLTAAALTWNALYAAALSTIEFGTPIPVFDWLFTFIPGLVAGSLFLRRGRMARQAAALCTGVVTVPLYALSWALLAL